MRKVIGKSREEIAKAIRHKTREELSNLIYHLETIEPHFSPKTIAFARALGPRMIVAKIQNGEIARAHRPTLKGWRVPLSAIREWDEQTSIRRFNTRSSSGRLSSLGKSPEEIARAIQHETMEELALIIHLRATLEPHFSPATIAVARQLHRRTIVRKIQSGEIPRAHRPTLKDWRVPQSAIREWDEKTLVR